MKRVHYFLRLWVLVVKSCNIVTNNGGSKNVPLLVNFFLGGGVCKGVI